MKKIHSISCGIAKYKFHQREISKLGIGSELSLRIKQKENGYKDIFVYNEDKEIGELFYEESTQLLPFVSDDKKFRVETIVKKLLPKEEDMVSVIVDIKIYCDEEVNIEEYIDDFYEKNNALEKEEILSDSNERNIIEEKKTELFYGNGSTSSISQKGISSAYLKIKEINPLLLKIKYLHGLPNINTPCHITFEPKKDRLQLLNFDKNNSILYSIKRKYIKNISVEDQTTIEKRIGFKRLLLVGIFALAWKKKQVNTLSYLVIEYTDDIGINQELYIQSEHKDGLQTFNNLKYNLYKFWNEVDTNPNIDEVLEKTIEQRKKIEQKQAEDANKGCMIMLIILSLLFVFFLIKCS